MSSGPWAAHATKEVGPIGAAREAATGADDKAPSPSAAVASQKSSYYPHSMDSVATVERLSPIWISSLKISSSVQSEAGSSERASQKGIPADTDSVDWLTGRGLRYLDLQTIRGKIEMPLRPTP